jgi:exodeoxyribonuclease VII large subunit
VNRLDGVDLCIVGRGGGAKEDLHVFDDEKVCRALAAVRVPTVSAVGHEIDISLADLVADARAATPSAAVELAVPDRAEVTQRVDALAAQLAHGLRRRTGLVTARLARAGDRVQAAMSRRVERQRDLVGRLGAQLEALSPLRVLARGYSVARLADGQVARRRSQLPAGTAFRLQVSDGAVAARSEGGG